MVGIDVIAQHLYQTSDMYLQRIEKVIVNPILMDENWRRPLQPNKHRIKFRVENLTFFKQTPRKKNPLLMFITLIAI